MFKRLRNLPSRIGNLITRNSMLLCEIYYSFILITSGISIGFIIAMICQ